MEPAGRDRRDVARSGVLFVQAIVTLAFAALAWLALDDITTDNSTGFLPEYLLLTAAGVWYLVVAHKLFGEGRRVFGAASVIAVAAAVWVASDGLGHKRDGGWSVFWPEYSVMLAAWLWFLAMSLVLFVLGRRAGPESSAGGA